MELLLHPGDVPGVPVARRRLVTWLRDHTSQDDELAAAELVIGEILANVVQHTTGTARVSLEWSGPQPRLRVADTGPGLSAIPSGPMPEDLAERGRGLLIASHLARSLVVTQGHQGGAVVMATLDLVRR